MFRFRFRLIVVVMIVVAGGLVACNLPAEEDLPPDPRLRLPMAEVSASREYACPGELIRVSWYAGLQTNACEGLETYSHSCKWSQMSGGGLNWFAEFTEPFLDGEQDVPMPPVVRQVTFTYMVAVGFSSHNVADRVSVSNPELTAPNHRMGFLLICDANSSTWQWKQVSDGTEDGSVRPCAAIERVCSTWLDGVEITTGDGTQDSFGIYECNETDFDGYRPEELNVRVPETETSRLVGDSCEPGVSYEEAVERGDIRRRDAEGFDPYFVIGYQIACMSPDQIGNEGYRDACERALGERTSESFTSEQGDQDDMGYEICVLDVTCGNGTCEDFCEDSANCPADCSDDGTPTDTPTPVPSGSQPDSGDGGDSPSGICSDNGGIQFQGEVCVCSGFVDEVTICNDGTKFDHVTDQACSPDPETCSGDDDGGGGNSCGANSCGNGTCESNCGEDPNNCPGDCP